MPLELHARVGAHVGPLGGAQAGVAAHDDVGRQRGRGQRAAQRAKERERAREPRARMRHPRIIGHRVGALSEHFGEESWPELTSAAIGTWSGGRFMHFGEPVDDDRLAALLRPGQGIATVITADAYGAGEARRAARPRARRGPARRIRARRRHRPRFLHGRARRCQGLPAIHRSAPARAGGLRGLRPDGDGAQPRALRRRRLRPVAAAQPGPHGLHERGGLGRAGGGPRGRPDARSWASRPAPPTASRST